MSVLVVMLSCEWFQYKFKSMPRIPCTKEKMLEALEKATFKVGLVATTCNSTSNPKTTPVNLSGLPVCNTFFSLFGGGYDRIGKRIRGNKKCMGEKIF